MPDAVFRTADMETEVGKEFFHKDLTGETNACLLKRANASVSGHCFNGYVNYRSQWGTKV